MTARWFEDPGGALSMMNAEQAARHLANIEEYKRWCDRQIAALTGVPGLMATEEPGRTRYVDLGAAGDVTARPPRQTRLRKTGPSLYDLRQAYLDAGTAIEAGEALLAFLGALGRVRSEADLDVLTRRPPARVRDEGGAALVLVAVMTVVIPALTLLTGWSTVAVVLYALTGLAVFRYATRRRRAGSVEIPGERETE